MTDASIQSATQWLAQLSDGDSSAISGLLPLVYDDLRQRAAGYLRNERKDHTLQPTALVHEAYLKLVNQSQARWKDRAHFLAVAAEAMRRILVDHARGKLAEKRDGGRRLTLDDAADLPTPISGELVELDAALKRLNERSERQARIVELRYFGGMSIEEVAQVLDVSPRTVSGDWLVARAWLQRELDRNAGE